MSVWVLHLPLTVAEEEALNRRTHLPLPFDDMPDMSMVGSIEQCRHLLRALYPDDPPEAIDRKIDLTWRQYAGLRIEDIIVVPLPSKKELAIAEVAGRYEYHVGEQGEDTHRVAVKWHDKRVPISKFGKFKHVFDATELSKMYEIADAEPRTIIRDRLPHTYNRFAAIKWILIIFFAIRGLMFILHMISQTEMPPL